MAPSSCWRSRASRRYCKPIRNVMTARTHTIHAPSTTGTSAAFVTDRTARAAGTTTPSTMAPRLMRG